VGFLERMDVPCILIPERHIGDPLAIVRLRQLLRKIDPHIVQTHGYKASCAMAALRVLGARARWVGCWHGSTTEDRKVRVYHALDRIALRFADYVLVMSAAQRALFSGFRAVRQVNNAVLDLAPTSELPKPRAKRMPPRLGVLGRLSSEKGGDVFLQACKLLRDRDVAFSAVFGGDGPDRRQLRELSESLGLGSVIAFAGTISNLDEFYNSIDLLVLPSRSEGLPNVLLEAIARSVPIVATRVGEVPTVLEEDGLGLLVPPERPDALADAIDEALHSLEFSQQARARVLGRYSLEGRVAAHLSVYHQLASKSR
jgi:glycosyltransferase involved in cell wall biosynthesis